MFGSLDIVNEFIEQIADILRTRAGFWVALEAEHGFVCQFDALQGIVKQGFVGNACVGGQSVGTIRRNVVLAGNDDFAAVQILYRVVWHRDG